MQADSDAEHASPTHALTRLRQENAALLAQLSTMRAELWSARRACHELEQRVEQAVRAAGHDELTGLVNRRVLGDRLQQAIAYGERHRQGFAILLIDLNGFKAINDRLGHNTGDAVLRAVAQRLLACARATDTVCRYGGDEFVILLSDSARPDAVRLMARKIEEHMREPLQIDDQVLEIGMAIGTARFPQDGVSAGPLIDSADRRMYGDKAARGERD